MWDVDGNRFVDLTAAFGVANAGHAHPAVTRAAAEQLEDLMHGMGDVHPSSVKVELLEALVRLYPGGGPARAVLGSSHQGGLAAAAPSGQAEDLHGRPRVPGTRAADSAIHGLERHVQRQSQPPR